MILRLFVLVGEWSFEMVLPDALPTRDRDRPGHAMRVIEKFALPA